MKTRVVELADRVAHWLRLPGCGWLCDWAAPGCGFTLGEVRRRREEFEFYKDPANLVPAGPGRRPKRTAGKRDSRS